MVTFKAEPRGKKSAKGTKSQSTSAFLLCRRSPISAGNPQILAAENRAGFHWASSFIDDISDLSPLEAMAYDARRSDGNSNASQRPTRRGLRGKEMPKGSKVLLPYPLSLLTSPTPLFTEEDLPNVFYYPAPDSPKNRPSFTSLEPIRIPHGQLEGKDVADVDDRVHGFGNGEKGGERECAQVQLPQSSYQAARHCQAQWFAANVPVQRQLCLRNGRPVFRVLAFLLRGWPGLKDRPFISSESDDFRFDVDLDLDVHVEGEAEYPMMLPLSLHSSPKVNLETDIASRLEEYR
ncbi:uncharacterized protein LACBIDRAFT_322393 [Laccaria bicolor S238N-H82]|uniref:Predicted protein n=1 Tax=Laccaria bicolor (strain S238N-H82 / ATCC MYA-4686) TaxID=486041 RepID=B0CW49_LACBS|nr:uncharacterized protein LACBIDRAFT_322393 [Laccaria bicolor S238N-H82]EDR13004.1 predicted protein [Laccaria bicolor S238N-H82]|eukprot:XP_001875502.1 predicted protein [Laccaria bicolor S238N-H82]